VLADAAQKATGKPKEVDAFIQAAVIRLAGLRGHGGEEGILADALNTHFMGGPEAWRFKKKSPASGGKSSVVHQKIELQKKVRLQHCQPWVATPLIDVVRGRCLQPCKILPGPSHFYCAKLPSKPSSASGEKRSDAASASGQKRSLEAAEESAQKRRRESLKLWCHAHTPSVLPQALWRCVNANTKSIALDLLPGEHFR